MHGAAIRTAMVLSFEQLWCCHSNNHGAGIGTAVVPPFIYGRPCDSILRFAVSKYHLTPPQRRINHMCIIPVHLSFLIARTFGRCCCRACFRNCIEWLARWSLHFRAGCGFHHGPYSTLLTQQKIPSLLGQTGFAREKCIYIYIILQSHLVYFGLKIPIS